MVTTRGSQDRKEHLEGGGEDRRKNRKRRSDDAKPAKPGSIQEDYCRKMIGEWEYRFLKYNKKPKNGSES